MIYPDEHMLYAPVEWQDCSEGYTDIRYHKSADGIAKITINRPQVRNAFRPLTVKGMPATTTLSASSSSPGKGRKPSAPAAIRKSAVTTADTRMMRARTT